LVVHTVLADAVAEIDYGFFLRYFFPMDIRRIAGVFLPARAQKCQLAWTIRVQLALRVAHDLSSNASRQKRVDACIGILVKKRSLIRTTSGRLF